MYCSVEVAVLVISVIFWLFSFLMLAINVIFVTGSLKRKKSSFTIDLTDVSKKGTKRMRYEYVFTHFDYLFNFPSGVQQS